jgi:hypothetical protein
MMHEGLFELSRLGKSPRKIVPQPWARDLQDVHMRDKDKTCFGLIWPIEQDEQLETFPT